MRFGFCTELFRQRGIEEAFEYLSDLGYDGVEVAPWTFTDSAMEVSGDGIRRAKEAAEKAEIEILGLHWVFGEDSMYHINHPDGDIRARTSDYLQKLVKLCAELGCQLLAFGSPNQRKVLEEVEYGEAWTYAQEVLGSQSLLDQLAEHDVTFCLEPLSEDQTNFINTAEEAIRFVEEMDHPNFQMMLDGYSLTWEKKAIPDIIRSSAPYLKHFHADDDTKKGPGCGDLDYEPIAKALTEINYNGFVSVEVHDLDLNPEETASRCIDYLNRIFR